MSELSEVLRKFIEHTAERNGFTNFEIQSKGGTVKGDNYMGVVKFIKIQDKNSENKLDLVLKTAHTSETLRKQVPLHRAYLREIFFYETILPELLSFQEKHNIQRPFSGAAKMYGILNKEGNESLILEDLRKSGFKLWNRKLPMNPEHVETVLREYARYHAISFAYKQLFPEDFADLTKDLKDIFDDGSEKGKEEMTKMIQYKFKQLYASLDDHPEARKAMEEFEEQSEDFFFNQLQTEENRLVILHGDCWCNNMMFKYENIINPQTPSKVCFLDWQLCKLGSPVMDLAYFLCVSVDIDILVDLDKYLNIYHEYLSENIREFGCDPEKIYPLETFKSQWQRFAKLGIWIACSLIPLVLSESEDTFDMAEVADSGKDLWEAFSKTSENKEVKNSVDKRMVDLITTLVKTKAL